MDQFIGELKKIPPVTRFITLSTVGISVPVVLKVLAPYHVVYASELVWKKFQFWRLYSSFFLGSGGINLIFEIVMLFRMSNQLETGPYASNSADYAYQAVLAATALLAITRPLNSYVLLHPLLACLSYISGKMAPPGSQTSFMGMVSVPVAYYPYIMVLMDLVMSGPHAAAETVAGLVVGHGWWLSVWGGGQLGGAGPLARFTRAPNWLVNWFGERRRRPSGDGLRRDESGAAAALRASGIEVVPPRHVRAASSQTGHSWGSGQRLGT